MMKQIRLAAPQTSQRLQGETNDWLTQSHGTWDLSVTALTWFPIMRDQQDPKNRYHLVSTDVDKKCRSGTEISHRLPAKVRLRDLLRNWNWKRAQPITLLVIGDVGLLIFFFFRIHVPYTEAIR